MLSLSYTTNIVPGIKGDEVSSSFFEEGELVSEYYDYNPQNIMTITHRKESPKVTLTLFGCWTAKNATWFQYFSHAAIRTAI